MHHLYYIIRQYSIITIQINEYTHYYTVYTVVMARYPEFVQTPYLFISNGQ